MKNWDDGLYESGKQGYGLTIVGVLMLIVLCLFVGLISVKGDGAPDSNPQYAEFPPQKGRYWVIVTRIIDADTVEGCFLVPSQRSWRIKDIDAPERNTEAGKVAKAYLADVTPFRVPIQATFDGPDSFKRLLIDYPSKTKPSVADELVAAGMAKRWGK